MLGFHLNPFIALIIVLSLVVAIPYALKRFRDKLPSLLKNAQDQKKNLSINEILPIDNKRRLESVNVGSKESGKTLLILTGGNNDVVVGWQESEKTETVIEEVTTLESGKVE